MTERRQSKQTIRIKFWDAGLVGGWRCAVEIDGRTYPVIRYVGDGHGAVAPVAFDSQAQARKAAFAEGRRIVRAGLPLAGENP